MLVLSRKAGESITARTKTGDVVDLLVIDIIGNRVKLGITAPESCSVRRSELSVNLDYTKRGAQ